MNALEGAGFVHLYGLSSVLNALSEGRRDLTTSLEKTEALNDSRFDELDDADSWDEDFSSRSSPQKEKEVKPEAQFRPYLFVQERRSSGSERRGSKASAAQEVMKLAEEKGVPIAYVDKGILNVLSGNRPHQGFALRCGKLHFEGLSRIPLPTNARGAESSSPGLWLVLDEVVDPQNLGALLRSAYFLGGKKNNMNVGVLVCSKNSAPPSPVVSASSAGALEVVDVHSTTNLPRTLNQAKDDGFRIIGASASVPSTSGPTEDGTPPPLYDLQDLPVRNDEGDNRPILLVMGSEGHGLRTLVAKACTEFVRIPSGMGGGSDLIDEDDEDNSSEAGVDSLNVSVSAGIMLWHLLHGGR
jgi:21S rRNA (GM2251-2'-O)-methyltransferase